METFAHDTELNIMTKSQKLVQNVVQDNFESLQVMIHTKLEMSKLPWERVEQVFKRTWNTT